jgi:hypothetical protein
VRRFGKFSVAHWLTLGHLRSATGLIIGLYVTMHVANHSLGLISVRAQEAVRPLGNGTVAFTAGPAAVVWEPLPLQEVSLRGRTDRLRVVALDQPTLRKLLRDTVAASV